MNKRIPLVERSLTPGGPAENGPEIGGGVLASLPLPLPRPRDDVVYGKKIHKDHTEEELSPIKEPGFADAELMSI